MPLGNSRADQTNRRCARVGAALFLLVFASAVVLPRQIFGHAGGEPAVSEVTVGPFVLYVWLDPVPAIVGEQHVTVSVNTPLTDAVEETVPLLEADVTVSAVFSSHSDVAVIAQATHDQAANKLFYESRLELPTAGSWQLFIEISSGLDTATFEFPLEVEEAKAKSVEKLWGRFLEWLGGFFPRP